MPRKRNLKAQRLRWLVLARLELAGLDASKMAQVTGYSHRTIGRTLELPVYQEWRDARMANGISAIDHIISGDAKEMKLALRELVPAAIQRLASALQSDDESIAIRAAESILDRDERFNKAAAQTITHTFTIPESEKQRAFAILKELKDSQPPREVHLPGETSVLDVTPSKLLTS